MNRTVYEIGRHAARATRSGIGWWISELGYFVPSRLRQRPLARIELRVSGSTATVVHISRRGCSDRGILELKGEKLAPQRFAKRLTQIEKALPIWLIPDPGAVLSRNLTLPRSAGNNFGALLSMEMDRWTPYATTEVVAGWTTLRQSDSSAEIQVRYIPRTVLNPLIETLRHVGLVPSDVVLGTEPGFRVPAPTMRSASYRERKLQRRMALLLLSIAAIALILSDWWATKRDLTRWHEAISIERKALVQQERLQHRINELFQLSNSQSGSAYTASAVLSALAAALPSTDWLTEVSIRQRSVTLHGYTASPDLLVKSLAPLAPDHEISLQGGLALDRRYGRHRFGLEVALSKASK